MMWQFTQALSQAVSAYAKPTAHQHGLLRLGRPGFLSPSRNSFFPTQMFPVFICQSPRTREPPWKISTTDIFY